MADIATMLPVASVPSDPCPPGAYIFDADSSSSTSSTYSSTQSSNDNELDRPSITDTPFPNVITVLSTDILIPPTQSVASYTVAESTYRVSRLPPAPTVYHAGPSRGPQRYLYFAVRRGHRTGVFTHWHEVERVVVDYPGPVFKTFSTRLAAEAFVAGWDGAGRHSLPSSSPYPLREHLAMSFPGSVPMPSTSSPGRKQAYHARLLNTPSSSSSPQDDFSPSLIDTTRPAMDPRRSSYRHSMVKISSPLRQQVDEEDSDGSETGSVRSRQPPMRKAASLIGIGGLLSPPQSPERQAKKLSVMDRERPTQRRSQTDTGSWSSRSHRDFNPSTGSLGLYSTPLSPPLSPVDKRSTIHGSPTRTQRAPSGLWADASPKPQQSSPLSPSGRSSPAPSPEFSDPTAPKFSRSAMKKSGVIMPVSAKRQNSSTSLRSKGSLNSLLTSSNNPSSSSLGSWSNGRRRSSVAQDRLGSLAETSKRELQLNEDGLLALGSLSPPRPAFMMRRSGSSSSVASDDSISSMGSMTSGSSAQTSSLDSCEPIMEEESRLDRDDYEIEVELTGGERDIISCTKSDGDADGSVGDKDSMKGGKQGKKGGKGGMFKRLAKALKLEKKTIPGQDSGRRGSM
ncbi:hypothetical protein I317_00210 [Kwoniella heveanensis CBS 569]|nr:hypothetical protein I317_00210 [Kwoniella heveanensis CBS 569]